MDQRNQGPPQGYVISPRDFDDDLWLGENWQLATYAHNAEPIPATWNPPVYVIRGYSQG